MPMKHCLMTSLTAALVLALAPSCSGEDGTIAAEGEAGSTASGGASASGGRDSASSGGSDATAGNAGDFWLSAYNASGLPNPADGNHHPGAGCMSCHTSGGEAWAFGGTVFLQGGINPASSVEVGVWDGTVFLSTYSARNGNFWVPASAGAIDWTHAEVRLRTSSGETVMPSSVTADCNSCHAGALVLVAP